MTENRWLGRRYDGGQSPLAVGGNLGPAPLYPTLDTANGDEKKPVGIKTSESIRQILTLAKDEDACLLPGWKTGFTVRYFKETLRTMNTSAQEFLNFEGRDQQKILRQIQRIYEKKARSFRDKGLRPGDIMPDTDNEAKLARSRLHKSLESWNAGDLRMEHPQGSSYHHLRNYETSVGIDGKIDNDPQCIVVENDWARAMSGRDAGGEVRMPFPDVCWEFRISGVRVLAFTVVEHDTTSMVLVYGRDGVWVSDDYCYVLPDVGTQLRGHPHQSAPKNNYIEFRRVADLVHSQIRAACILLDVEAVRKTHVAASPALVKRAKSERRHAPRDHVVVQLAPRTVRRHRAHSAGYGVTDKTPQRGHLRRGTYVHYDDQDSGEEQYVNDGGFIVSKTWRKWHWAGDLNNMIEREYRL